MHTNNLIIDNRTTRQTIKGVTVVFPELDGVTAATFVVEAVYAVDGGALVVSAEDEEVFGVFDLVGEEE